MEVPDVKAILKHRLEARQRGTLKKKNRPSHVECSRTVVLKRRKCLRRGKRKLYTDLVNIFVNANWDKSEPYGRYNNRKNKCKQQPKNERSKNNYHRRLIDDCAQHPEIRLNIPRAFDRDSAAAIR